MQCDVVRIVASLLDEACSSLGGGRGRYSTADGDFPVALVNRMKPDNFLRRDQVEMVDMTTSGACSGAANILIKDFVVISWNACGMEAGAVNDVTKLLEEDNRSWDAIMLQEGPFSQHESYSIVDGGHALFLGSSGLGKRSVGILLHRKWIQREAKLRFKSVGVRVASLDIELDKLRLRLTSAHLPHMEYSRDTYEAELLVLEGILESARRDHRMNVIGVDANAVIGARREGESANIVGEYTFGQRNERGHLLVPWMHYMNTAAVSTMHPTTAAQIWTHELWGNGVRRQIDFIFMDEIRRGLVLDTGIVEELAGKSDHRAISARFSVQQYASARSKRARIKVGWRPALNTEGTPAVFH